MYQLEIEAWQIQITDKVFILTVEVISEEHTW